MEGDELMSVLSDLKVCPHCGAAVPLDAGLAHFKWHDNLDALIEQLIATDLPLAKVLTLVKETNE
jgi:hypothetical protein